MLFVLIVSLLSLLVLISIVFFYKAKLSQKISSINHLSINQTKLKPCGKKPNCVCTEYVTDKSHFIEPSDYELDEELLIKKIISVIEDMQGKLIHQKANYLAIEFRSSLFGFVDDMEIRLDSTNKKIHYRSASRVGYSDFGKNHKCINAIKKNLLKLGNN